eukprot:NODE_6552_length_838_cov_58.155245_g6316_i0.p1 GENE.NODE_6552_length_838_cov_58.155245_g6316_i0~~NODE_6552_length_838_cov_58.155245_g6316_i0.p1  ORF type:complete len:212 (-),score=35.75 NODE_6552_length_838_cov_58.155245_g6316_i0:117-752(-)
MPILYAAIAAKNEIFAEYPEKEYPKLAEVCGRIISQIPLNDQPRKKTFEESTYKFHYKSQGDHVYICVAHKELQMRVCYAFLESVASRLLGGKAQADFQSPKKLLKERMEFHNNPQNDAITALDKDLEELKDVMFENMDRVLNRGEKIDALTDKSNRLALNASDFHKSARTLKRNFCLKHAKMVVLCSFLVLVVILIILMMVCNPNFSNCS